MLVGFRWLDEGLAQDSCDFFDKSLFEENVKNLPIRHDVLRRNGQLLAQANALLTVNDSEISLDYEAIPQTRGEVIVGVTAFNYNKLAAQCITNVRFKALDEVHFERCSIAYLERPAKETTSTNSVDEEQEFASAYALSLSPETLHSLLPAEGTKPRRLTVTTEVFSRNPYVVAAALLRAAGKCEECKNDAPFIGRATGKPYLEVHHRKQLAKGGSDDLSNTIVVCPNCHRRFHYGIEAN